MLKEWLVLVSKVQYHLLLNLHQLLDSADNLLFAWVPSTDKNGIIFIGHRPYIFPLGFDASRDLINTPIIIYPNFFFSSIALRPNITFKFLPLELTKKVCHWTEHCSRWIKMKKLVGWGSARPFLTPYWSLLFTML